MYVFFFVTRFGQCFKQPLAVGILPKSLSQSTIGENFDQLIEQDVLHSHCIVNVKKMRNNRNFNQSITVGMLPSSLTHLHFGKGFDQPVDPGVLPTSLTHSTVGENFNQPIHMSFRCVMTKPIKQMDC